jgi:mRNA interferase MazF
MALNDLNKWDLVFVDLNSGASSDISRQVIGLVISPNAANKHLPTVIIAPLTSSIRQYPTRLAYGGKPLEICFDQMKSINKSRIIRVLGALKVEDRGRVNTLLAYMFSEP